jgi:hypothetical protein
VREPSLASKISKNFGVAGEYYVCAVLCRIGILALITPKNNPLYDILAADPLVRRMFCGTDIIVLGYSPSRAGQGIYVRLEAQAAGVPCSGPTSPQQDLKWVRKKNHELL